MATIIHSNGSKWLGEEPDSVDQLIAVMGAHKLNDYTHIALIPDDRPCGGGYRFCGNFDSIAHVFSIDTTDRDMIDRLVAAFRANGAPVEVSDWHTGETIAPAPLATVEV